MPASIDLSNRIAIHPGCREFVRVVEALDLPARFAIPVVTSDGQRLTVRPYSTIMPNYAYPRAISFLSVPE